MIIQIEINEKEHNLFKQYCTLFETKPEKDLKEYTYARAKEMEKYLQKQ